MQSAYRSARLSKNDGAGKLAGGWTVDRRNGMRRLGLLLGIAGALLGCVYSTKELKIILAYHKFTSLAESDFVKKEAASYIADVEKARTAYFERERWVESQIAALRGKDGYEDFRRKEGLALQGGNFAEQASENLFRIEKRHSEINRSGLKQIQWTYGYAHSSIDPDYPWPRHLDITSIETQDGETLYQTVAPRNWTYALLILVPAFGFLVPWGAVRGIEWVLAGFSRSPSV